MLVKVRATRVARAGIAVLFAGLSAAALTAAPGDAATPLPPRGTTEIISVGADHHAFGGTFPRLSADGHYVLYNIGPAPHHNVLLRDRFAQATTTVFAADDQVSGALDLSANGRFAFYYTDALSDIQIGAGQPRIHRYNVATGASSLVPLPDDVAAADQWRVLVADTDTTGRYLVVTYQVTPDDQAAVQGVSTYVTDLRTRETFNIGIDIAPAPVNPRLGSTVATDISGDGRFVAYESTKSHSPNDRNGHLDSYVVDWRTGNTTLVSRRPNGRATDDIAWGGVLSENGRYVTFGSLAGGGLPGLPADGRGRVFQYDTQTNTTTVITTDTADGTNYGTLCGASSTGRYVAFHSGSENFGFPTNPNAIADRTQIFRYDRKHDSLHLVTHARRQAWGSKESVDGDCTIAADGQLVAYSSIARDLVIDPELVDAYSTLDVFVWTD